MITVASKHINESEEAKDWCFGSLVMNQQTKKLTHLSKNYQFAPSNSYSCGVYIFSRDIQQHLTEKHKQLESKQLTSSNDDL